VEGTGPARSDLVRSEFERTLHPGSGTSSTGIEAQHRRQDAGKEIAFETVATEEDEFCQSFKRSGTASRGLAFIGPGR